MSDRIARECYICSEERNRTGDETIQVMYKKLSQHLKVKHALSAEQARSAASRLKRMGALKKSAAGRNYFMCIECRCVVVRKDNHLFSKYHRMVAGTTEYHRAMKTLFKRAQHAMPAFGFPVPGPMPEVDNHNHDIPDIVFSDQDDSDDLHQPSSSPSPAPAPAPGFEPETHNTRYMRVEDCVFRKYSSLWLSCVPCCP